MMGDGEWNIKKKQQETFCLYILVIIDLVVQITLILVVVDFLFVILV
jgi:hypothetical protein